MTCCCPHIVANLAASKVLAEEQLGPPYAGEYLRNLAILDAAEEVFLRGAIAFMGQRRRGLLKWLEGGYKDGKPSWEVLGRTPDLMGSMLDLFEAFAAKCWVKGVTTGRRDVSEALAQDERDGDGEGLGELRGETSRGLGVALRDFFAQFNMPGDDDKSHPAPMGAIEYVLQRRDLLRFFDANLVEDVKATLVRILEDGLILNEAKAELEKVLTTYTQARLINVVRTESISAFNAGRLAHFDSVSHLVKGVKFVAIIDHRTTPICRDRNGLILPLSHPLVRTNTPPLHYQCRSVWSPVTKGRWKKAVGMDPKDPDFPAAEAAYILQQLNHLDAARPVMKGFGDLALKPLPAQPRTPIYSGKQGGKLQPETSPPKPLPTPRPKAKSKIHSDLEDPAAVVEFSNGNQGVNKATAGQSPFDVDNPHPYLNGERLKPIGFQPTYSSIPDEIKDPEWKPGGPAQKSTGIIILEDDGRIWLYRPHGQYGGYKATFPKGQMEAGLTAQQNAIKETFEETGLASEVIAHLGDYAKTTSTSRYYIGRRTGGAPWKAGWEADGVVLTPLVDAQGILNHHLDKAILKDLEGFLDEAKAHGKGRTLTAQVKAYYEHKAAEAEKAAAAAAKQLQRETEALQKALAEEQRRQEKAAKKAAAEAAKQAAATAKAQADAIKAANAPLKFSDFEQYAGQQGGNQGGFYRHKVTGEKWYLKRPPSTEHSRSEVLATKLYALAGNDVPEVRLLEGWGSELGVASRIVEGLKTFPDPAPTALGQKQRLEAIKKAKGWKEGFGADAWLANHDTVGSYFDNMLVVEKGNTILRLDTGGALHYRALGARKVFNGDVGEVHSMRNKAYNSGKLFGAMKEWEVAESIARVTSLKATDIRDTVYAAGFGDDMIKALLQRQQYLADYAKGLKPKPVSKTKAAKVVAPVFNPGTIPALPEMDGQFTTVAKMHTHALKVKGNYLKAKGYGTDYVQRLRYQEMAAAVGQDAADKIARGWRSWQGNANNDGAWTLNNAWEWIHEGRGVVTRDWGTVPITPKDDDIVNGLLFTQKVVAATFKTTKGKAGKANTITVHRGFNWDQNKYEALAAAGMGKTKCRMTVRSLNCWSSNPAKARAFAGSQGIVVGDQEFGLERIAGGMGLSPGFNEDHLFDDEKEIIIGADTLNGSKSTHIFDLEKITSAAWYGRNAIQQAEYLRANNPAELARIVAQYGTNQANLRRRVLGRLLWLAGEKLKEIRAMMKRDVGKKTKFDKGAGRLDDIEPGWQEEALAQARAGYEAQKKALAELDQGEIFDLTPMPEEVAARNANWTHYVGK